MKKSILNIGTALTRSEQKAILGGRDPKNQPCGETGGMIVNISHCYAGSYGTRLINGTCWACF